MRPVAVRLARDDNVYKTKPAEASTPKSVEIVPVTPRQHSQQVLKAEAARPDATDRETAATPSPRVGAMGAGQPADAGPAAEHLIGRTATISMTGEIAVVAQCGTVTLFDKDSAQRLLRFLAGRVA